MAQWCSWLSASYLATKSTVPPIRSFRQLLRWHIPPEARYQSPPSPLHTKTNTKKNPLFVGGVSPDPDLSTAFEVTVRG